jgi:hypothetical protein
VIATADTAPAVDASPGRSCPLHYRYRPEDFGVEAPEHLRALDVLYVVGGLYGNEAGPGAGAGTLRAANAGASGWSSTATSTGSMPTRPVRARAARVLAHEATRGNVETELAAPDAEADAGCGCAYPDWVGDGVVERSNRILARCGAWRTTRQRSALSALPMWLRADVGPLRLGLVHGDATSLAGWGFAQEHLRDAEHRAEVARWLDRAGVHAFACTHTCLPVFQALPGAQGGPRAGSSTTAPPACPTSAMTPQAADPHRRRAIGGAEPALRRRAGRRRGRRGIAIDTDAPAWRARFEALWPAGTDAHQSYFDRIVRGPDYAAADVVLFRG